MANIYDKEFDASKRLDRTIFRGSPNLFTTADLNFQLENIRRDIKRSDWIHGAGGGMGISTSYNTGIGKLTVSLAAHGNFTVGGIHTPASMAQSLEITVGYNDPVYLFIEGTYSVKTYADDPIHGFVGAQFDDGTSMPAADQRVVENFAYHLARHDDEDPYWDDLYEDIDTKFCFLIAKIVQIDATTAYIYKNFASDLDTPMMNPKPYINEITALDSEKELVAGDPFDVAISKLIKKDALRKSDITSLLSRPYVNESEWHTEDDMKWIIRNNNLFISIDRLIYGPSGSGNIYVKVADYQHFSDRILEIRASSSVQRLMFGVAFAQYVECFHEIPISYTYEYGDSFNVTRYQKFIPLFNYTGQQQLGKLIPFSTEGDEPLEIRNRLYGEIGLCLEYAEDAWSENIVFVRAFIGFCTHSELRSTEEDVTLPIDYIPAQTVAVPLSF